MLRRSDYFIKKGGNWLTKVEGKEVEWEVVGVEEVEVEAAEVVDDSSNSYLVITRERLYWKLYALYNANSMEFYLNCYSRECVLSTL